METPQLYRQLEAQLRQWVLPKDRRHLQGYRFGDREEGEDEFE